MSQRAFGRLLYDLSLGAPPAPQHGGTPRVESSPNKQFCHGWPLGFDLHTCIVCGAALLSVVMAVMGGWFSANPGRTPAISFEAHGARPEVVAVIARNEREVVADSEPITTPQLIEVPARTKVTTLPVARVRRKSVVFAPATRLYPVRDVQELQNELEMRSREIGLKASKGKSKVLTMTLVEDARERSLPPTVGTKSVAELLARSPELLGLPFNGDGDCQIAESTLPLMKSISQQLGRARGVAFRQSESIDVSGQIRHLLDNSPQWKSPAAVPTLVQILQVEDETIRLSLIRLLATVPGVEASRALADRALFDLSTYVRWAANDALQTRPLPEFQERLLSGFRHPWPEVARHAAETCVQLNAPELIQPLTALLSLPDPSTPRRNASGEWVQVELVRLNHHNNCTLCHPGATSAGEGFSASIPIPGSNAYGHFTDGPAVRADVVYLRQDFSIVHDAPNHQRYDYLLQTRRLDENEVRCVLAKRTDVGKSYPQRDAVASTVARLRQRAH